MIGLKQTWLWLLLSVTAATFAHPDHGLQSLHLNTIEKRQLDAPTLHKRCSGSCEECFGQGYQECASSSSICFKPGDSLHGEETCSESSTTTPTVPITDYCSDGSCEQCFGTGSTECPGSTSQCYTPGDSLSGIESCSSSGSSSSDTTPSSSSDLPTSSAVSDSSSTSGSNITSTDFCDNGGFDCKRCFGNSFIPCPEAPTSYCYDPNNSTTVCSDGTSPAGSSDSSSGTVYTSGSADYTSSTSPATTDTASTPPVTTNTDSPTGSSTATGTSNGGTNVFGSTTSSTFTSSRTSSAGGSTQTSATSGGSNGNPASATGNGQPSVGEGKFRVLAVLALCFTAAAGFIF